MALASDVPNEEIYPIELGSGMYTAELASNIPDGFSPIAYNLVATGDSVENRIGIKRMSFDWKVAEIAPGSKQALPGAATTFADDMNIFTQIDPWSRDSTKVAFAWAGRGLAIPGLGLNTPVLNLVRSGGTVDANDGFMSIILADPCIGICQYQGTIYYSLWGNGVRKILTINWATDAITSSAIASTAAGTIRGLFVFKDRMWGWGTGVNEHKLYFTDIPATGGLPETWAFAVNVIPFVGPNGAGAIKKVVPLGNRLAVFTTNGLFTLLVEGAPASWILRVLDSKSICTTRQCAFESKGIIYFVNTEGVWATNTLSVKKLSAVIEDQWFLAKGYRSHSLVPYEDGMIVSIAKTKQADDKYFDKENCKTFYSKLDPIAWTEWNVNRYGLGALNDQIAMIWSTTDKIPTYLNNDPTVYTFVLLSDSTDAAPQYAVGQILIMDGGEDQWVDRSNTARSLAVGIYVKTKHFDGGNPFRMKQAKFGMLEIFTSDSDHIFTTSWDYDYTIDQATEIEDRTLSDFTVGTGSNFVKFPGMFPFRRASLNIRASLQTATSQIKIKQAALVQDTLRDVIEQVN